MAERGGTRLLTLALACALLMASPAEAQSRRYWVDSFDATFEVTREGVLLVEERLTFAFEGSFNGVYRDIATRVNTPWGLDYRIRLQPVAITDDRGNSLEYETSWQGDDRRFKIWVPGAQDARRTVILRYRVERALRFLGADPEPAEVEDAVEYARFDNMRRLEDQSLIAASGRRLVPGERGRNDSYKVRRAKVGGWRDYFDAAQIAELDARVESGLRPGFGYNSEDSSPAVRPRSDAERMGPEGEGRCAG